MNTSGYSRKGGHLYLVMREKVRPTHFGSERVYFTDELRVAFILGVTAGALVTVLLAGVWAWL